MNDQKFFVEELKMTISNSKIFEKLIDIENSIDEKMYITRLNIQENLILPTPKIKASLRLHIFSYITKTERCEDDMLVDDKCLGRNIWVLRIQGKIMPVLETQPGGFYRKFSYFFSRIEIKFDPSNDEKFQDIEWSKNNNSDFDGFEIKRESKSNEDIKLKIILYLNYYIPEYQVSDELSKLIGIKQDTRPKILNHLWQYIKINSLQDNENPNIIINNKELQSVFKCEKMEISSLTYSIIDHISLPDPIVIGYTIKSGGEWNHNQKLLDIVVNVDDPHFLDISNFLSNSTNESLLFPKNLFFNKYDNQKEKIFSDPELFFTKLQDYERYFNELVDKLKKHKYKFDFYDFFSKDPINFINNFIIQQNSLLKIMKEESAIIDARWDYNSAQYYKDYEEILREFIENYINKEKIN